MWKCQPPHPQFLYWCWHLAWYQRWLLQCTSHRRKHACRHYSSVSERLFWCNNGNLDSSFQLFYPLFYECGHVLSISCGAHCLVETKFKSLHPQPDTFPVFHPSSSPVSSPSNHHSVPRWLWGRPVWNVIGIIPFSLIASVGEQPYVSHRVLPNLSEHIIHTFHIETSSKNIKNKNKYRYTPRH